VSSSAHRVAEEIRRYCAAHPGARDTLEGIVWWVQMQRQEDIRSSVSEAVAWLVAQGALERFELQDGSEVFGCAKSPPGPAP
jgi:hypothetical protein